VNKDTIARSFLHGQRTYDTHAKVQRNVSERLVTKLKEYQEIQYNRVLEIGCCTGTLTELLVNSSDIKKLYLNDLVPSFYDTVIERLSKPLEVDVVPLFGDIETIDFPQELDLVITSSTLQWIIDISALINKVASSLQKRGFFVFSLFGPGTLREFRAITGVGLDYCASGTIMDLLENHFNIEEEGAKKDVIYFSTPREVLRHLQATGVGGVKDYRWTSKGIRNFERNYSEQFGVAEGIPVTYMSYNFVASKKG
jgi:malonyl-CoA O-methyltransferase